MDTPDTNQTPKTSTTEEMQALLANRLNLEAMIKRAVADIDKVKEKLVTQKDIITSAYENDAKYVEAQMEEKKAKKVTATAKERIMKEPGVMTSTQAANELKSELKDLQEELSDLLRSYMDVAQSNEIIGDDGEIRQIIQTHKLVKKNKEFKRR